MRIGIAAFSCMLEVTVFAALRTEAPTRATGGGVAAGVMKVALYDGTTRGSRAEESVEIKMRQR